MGPIFRKPINNTYDLAHLYFIIPKHCSHANGYRVYIFLFFLSSFFPSLSLSRPLVLSFSPLTSNDINNIRPRYDLSQLRLISIYILLLFIPARNIVYPPQWRYFTLNLGGSRARRKVSIAILFFPPPLAICGSLTGVYAQKLSPREKEHVRAALMAATERKRLSPFSLFSSFFFFLKTPFPRYMSRINLKRCCV